MRLLTTDEISQRIENEFPSWNFEESHLVKKFNFQSFDESVEFFNALAEIASDLNHHPEFYNSYNKCTVKIQTHHIGGISELDFEFLSRVELLFHSLK